MKATEYILQEWNAGRLRPHHIEKMTRVYQRSRGLIVDGMPGPSTRGELDPGFACWPLRALSDGRKPVITSAFRTRDRPNHNGIDLFFKYLDSDPSMKAGDGGAVVRKGERKWWIPPKTTAVAVADAVVSRVGKIGTGWRVWLQHENGRQSGYFHLRNATVEAGQQISAGYDLGEVGDNPRGHDAVHLHFEVTGSLPYRPIDPEPFLEGADVLDAF